MSAISVRLIKTQEKEEYIIVSKKVAKKATERNLIKRRIRALLRKIVPKDFMGRITIVAREGILKKKFKELEEELYEELRKYIKL